ncbi:MAG: hypothetical protein GVY15_02075 [Bacteroidetes bacterium]|jgi:DNA-binding NarL/FixJ family response regulator|nr:hypothetical protein [Bacteroidota bacterium]
MLSSDDQRALQAAQRALLSPPAVSGDDLSGWIESVCAALRRLLNTDHVYYLEPEDLSLPRPRGADRAQASGGHNDAATQGRRDTGDGLPSARPVLDTGQRLFVHSPSAGATFAEGINRHFLGFKNGFSQFREAYPTLQHEIIRGAGAGAFHDAPLHDWTLREQLDIYQEVFRAPRIHRQACLAAPLPQGEAMLIAGFAHDRAPAYEGRRHQLMKLLVPAFEASLRFRQRLVENQQRLADVLDRLDVALLLFDGDGRERYRNRACRRLMAATEEADALASLARTLAQELTASTASSPLAGAQKELRLTSGRYHLSASYDTALLGDSSVLVAVERSSVLPSIERLKERSALTPREAEVAHLMARGRSDQEIADELFISVYTVRRHTAQVLDKLGLQSRAGVAVALLRLA